MTTPNVARPSDALQGVANHLNIEAGFGCMLETSGGSRRIFVARAACPWSAFGRLEVGQQVRFVFNGAGRVVELVKVTRRAGGCFVAPPPRPCAASRDYLGGLGFHPFGLPRVLTFFGPSTNSSSARLWPCV